MDTQPSILYLFIKPICFPLVVHIAGLTHTVNNFLLHKVKAGFLMDVFWLPFRWCKSCFEDLKLFLYVSLINKSRLKYSRNPDVVSLLKDTLFCLKGSLVYMVANTIKSHYNDMYLCGP